jgi:branched-chain amino acid transport system substrate-binding protein
VKGLRGLGLGWDLFGTHHLTRLAFHPTAAQAEGIHVPRLFTVPEEDGPARAFAEAFMARHGTPPDYIAAYTYDATSLLLEAVRRGGLNRARVRDALSRLISWRGVTGPFQWDNTGRNTGHTVRMDTLHACASGDGDSAVPAGASRPGRPTQ